MNHAPADVEAGAAVYNRDTLNWYDFVVLRLSNQWIWRCSTERLVAHYNAHVSGNHLDVGVGTGFFVDRCEFPVDSPRVALMDLNNHALDYAANRIERHRPEKYRANVLEPIRLDLRPFDSIGINYLLHCLPGTMETKSVVFDHLKELMNPKAVLFGSTLLQDGVRRSWPARQLMRLYNRKKIFSNRCDSLASLSEMLHQRFPSVSVDVVGCAALFSART